MEAVPFIGIDRHRLGVDGVGVTTLAAFHGCLLRCKYCLNRRCLEAPDGLPRYSPEELYQRVSIDNLYFIATGGGVCFGGGEPLLRIDFIEAFRALCGKSWNLTAETSLQVPAESVRRAAGVVNDFIVDIKRPRHLQRLHRRRRQPRVGQPAAATLARRAGARHRPRPPHPLLQYRGRHRPHRRPPRRPRRHPPRPLHLPRTINSV